MLKVAQLHKVYGTGTEAVEAVRDLSFEVAEGELVCIVGPSGCGKTTLLKCVAGLLPLSGGEVTVHGQAVDGPVDAMALVFQDYSRSLMPWLTVRKNVLLPLRRTSLGRSERDRLIIDAVEAMGLSAFIDSYPWQLSGGMQQRVAIARALAVQPQLLLMDEPFASVDAQTRADLEDLVLRVRQDTNMTILFVTHDVDEAVYLADRVIVLSAAPTVVDLELTVELPADRDQVATKELADFAQLRSTVLRTIQRAQNQDQTRPGTGTSTTSPASVNGVRDG